MSGVSCNKHNLHYITVATKPHPILELIQNRIEKQGEHITVLGLEENRSIGWNAYANFGVKLREVYMYIWNVELDPEDIILFTDAYDVIYCGNQEEIIKKYLELDTPIIFGAETICNPDPNREAEYNNRHLQFPYLNSGLYIGRVWALRECMIGYSYNDADDDQRYWTNYLFKRADLIKLDYNNSLFLNTAGINIKEIEWDGNIAKYKNKIPMFVHVNGPDKSELKHFL
jgi:hypothetical protein